jgi:hypothetical protein
MPAYAYAYGRQSYWWLWLPRYGLYHAAYVIPDDTIDTQGSNSLFDLSVRPALWLDY